MKKEIKTTLAPAAIGPYSQGVVAPRGAAFLSGQLPVNPVDGKLPEGIEAQTRQALDNVKAVLAEGGYTLCDVVKTTVFMQNLKDFVAMNAVYQEYFKPPYPARSTVQVAAIPKGADLEIECVAVRNEELF